MIMIIMCIYIPPSNRISRCLFLSAGNESCPQPQTSEHLAAIEIMKLKHILILQNKIDLVKESQAHDQYDQILKFVQGQSRLFKVKVLNVNGGSCSCLITPLSAELIFQI